MEASLRGSGMIKPKTSSSGSTTFAAETTTISPPVEIVYTVNQTQLIDIMDLAPMHA
jgi:hypothetical protein